MNTSVHPLRVLLIGRDAERTRMVECALAAAGHVVVGRMQSTLGLLDEVTRLKSDVILIDTGSPDRNMLEHICLLSEHAPSPVVVFTDDADRNRIRDCVRAGVTAYVVDALATDRVGAIVEVALAQFEAYQAVKNERDRARARLAERKLVERAKGILMRKRAVDEDEAYRLLRKIAMEKSLSMSKIAEQVIGMSDLIG